MAATFDAPTSRRSLSNSALGIISDDFRLPLDYNIMPSTFQRVIRSNKQTSQRDILLMRRDLIRFFSSRRRPVLGYKIMNSLCENVLPGSTWREPFKKHRCLHKFKRRLRREHQSSETARDAAVLRSGLLCISGFIAVQDDKVVVTFSDGRDASLSTDEVHKSALRPHFFQDETETKKVFEELSDYMANTARSAEAADRAVPSQD